MKGAETESLIQLASEIRDQLKRIADALDEANAPHREWKLDQAAQQFSESAREQ
jgi:hypothetical protein